MSLPPYRLSSRRGLQRVIRAGVFGAICPLMIAAANAKNAETSEGLLNRAVECGLEENALAKLPEMLKNADAGFNNPRQRFDSPVFTKYRLEHPIILFGYKSEEIVMMPGRVLALIPAKERRGIEKTLGLKQSPFSFMPSARIVKENRSLVAFEMQSEGVKDQVMVGCEYALKDASSWGTD